ncbi:MAG: DinB family protein [Gemmatimonadetes bacterium]|nr:DinB family protein [Gemmatimonadota bacterium]
MSDETLRPYLVRLLGWRDAHVDFAAAVHGIPHALRGSRPSGLPYSPWELLEHLRFTQRDILDFCRNPSYIEPGWPAEYWPASAEPPTPEAWDAAVARFNEDLEALKRLAEDTTIDLFDAVPQGTGQTYLRELLLVADHNAYHVGELVAVRRLLNAWPSD